MPKVHTLEVKEQFVELRAKGHTFSHIADQLQVSKPTLIDWAKELQDEIENSRTLEMEALQEKHYATWKQRLEFTGKEFSRLQEELESRDFSDMSTKELYEIALKFQAQLKSLERKGALKVQVDPSEELTRMLASQSFANIEI